MDVRVGKSVRSRKTRVRFIEDVVRGDQIFDIVPKTMRQFRGVLKGAKCIVLYVSMGFLENRGGVRGTKALAKAIANAKGARTVLGGGDTVSFVERSGYAKKFSFISTGGGAMLEFLAGKKLPGLEVLKK